MDLLYKTVSTLKQRIDSAKPSTRESQIKRNINAFKELRTEIGDLMNFLAEVTLGVYYRGGPTGVYCRELCRVYRVQLRGLTSLTDHILRIDI